MKKKLTAQGPKTRKSYTVTLPLDWVKSQGLDKTKIVNLEIIGPKIVISSEQEAAERIIFDGTQFKNEIIKVLQGMYRLGVDQLKIFYKDHSILKEAARILNERLIGYEIIEQTRDYIIVKDITKEASEDFDTIFRRVFLLLLEITKAQTEDQILSIDANIKKLVNYCQRILIKQGHSDYLRVPFYYVLLDQLEKINDEFKWLLRLKLKKKTETVLLQEINLCMRKAYELYYKFDPVEYNKYELLTYQIKSRIKRTERMSTVEMHIHNLARQLNTVYGNILVLRYKKK